jgi:hypothetical protein
MTARLLLLLMLVAARVATAQSVVCPWLATGTATSVLGGEVTVTAHSNNNWEGSCRFAHGIASGMQAIEIRVGKVNPHACPDGSTKLNALGNEAVQCHRTAASNEVEDTIAGRVRDAYFVVTLTKVPEAAREANEDLHSPIDPYGASILERIAEQVAGNLF